ncbi:hypothetical protein K2173_027637 [Erythroxylum novogranatense]|uniref:DUF676 domain-containing protein n=1 Tax=Erythroxylum novogranatense TaxID=1862640 RepID=A0AAV8U259_9ROSI|nr:hypothetical protein K2173_027637 [Erythroxylum novogranatense]
MEKGIVGRAVRNRVLENRVCSSESVSGSRDVWSCTDAEASSADHLVIMVHGILGSAKDWKFAAEQFARSFPIKCSERNMSKLTLDGVDVMGDRLAKEVLEVIQRKPNLQKISFVAHSVGGLVARYVIGKLYRPPKTENLEDSMAAGEDLRGTIGGLEAMNFITVATPHLNNDEGKPPLLKRMIQDSMIFILLEPNTFMQVGIIRTFKRRVVYSNVGYDHIVGWRTSSIRRNSDLPKHCKASGTEQHDLTDDSSSDKLEEELVTGLSTVSWEKVDVSFHTCRQRFAAHSVIQVKDHVLHREGADVIEHMIDHFHL